MQASIAAALLAALLSAGWLLGRRRPALVRNPDTHDVAALNRAQISLVHSGGASQPDLPPASRHRPSPAGTLAGGNPDSRNGPRFPGSPSAFLPPPGTPGGLPKGQGRAYVARLGSLYRGDGEARLRAIEAAHQWGDRLALPLLRRALRDSDPLVMRAAALAIERFRGRTTAAAPLAAQPPAAPRRVSRTR